MFELSQPLGIISGLKERFIKRHIVERTNTAEEEKKRPEEQSERTESCRENFRNEIQLKGHKDRNRHKNRMKRSGQARLVYVTDINRNIPTTSRWSHEDSSGEKAVKRRVEAHLSPDAKLLFLSPVWEHEWYFLKFPLDDNPPKTTTTTKNTPPPHTKG